MKSGANAIDIVAWKAKKMGVSYGVLWSTKSAKDLERWAKEREEEKKAEHARLCEEARLRHMREKGREG